MGVVRFVLRRRRNFDCHKQTITFDGQIYLLALLCIVNSISVYVCGSGGVILMYITFLSDIDIEIVFR
jgi:hypothetical protein